MFSQGPCQSTGAMPTTMFNSPLRALGPAFRISTSANILPKSGRTARTAWGQRQTTPSLKYEIV